MVTITNGSRTTVVTHGVYDEVYKPSGWHEIAPEANEKMMNDSLPEEDPITPEIQDNTPEERQEEIEATLTDETDVEIPLSEMKVSELREFAEAHDIDVSAAKNKKGMIDIIHSEM